MEKNLDRSRVRRERIGGANILGQHLAKGIVEGNGDWGKSF